MWYKMLINHYSFLLKHILQKQHKLAGAVLTSDIAYIIFRGTVRGRDLDKQI